MHSISTFCNQFQLSALFRDLFTFSQPMSVLKFLHTFYHEKQTLCKMGERKLKHSQKSVKRNKRREKENSKLYEYKACSSAGILSIYHLVLSFAEKIIRSKKTLSYRFVRFVITSWF